MRLCSVSLVRLAPLGSRPSGPRLAPQHHQKSGAPAVTHGPQTGRRAERRLAGCDGHWHTGGGDKMPSAMAEANRWRSEDGLDATSSRNLGTSYGEHCIRDVEPPKQANVPKVRKLAETFIERAFFPPRRVSDRAIRPVAGSYNFMSWYPGDIPDVTHIAPSPYCRYSRGSAVQDLGSWRFFSRCRGSRSGLDFSGETLDSE
ncbi:hypothetical protein F5Y06DRAFT_268905 [Hypoxylon sp. FL0890]|nr:hypothetical protein F5Y06DRAFT_268905 [Hypoxylon sp. FL0890]